MERKDVGRRFGERVRAERKHRGWTQPELAKMLTDKGIPQIHSVTISKIESGDRPVRITEAVGLAECFGVSVDALLGHSTDLRDDQEYALRSLRITADRSAHQIRDIASVLGERLADVYGPGLHEVWPKRAQIAWNSMSDAMSALLELAQEESE